MRLVLVLAALAVLCSCAETRTERVAAVQPRYAAHGVSVELPPGWQAAPGSLTPHLSDPREVMSVGTYPLRYRTTACAHMAGSALEDLGPEDAFVTVQERGAGASSSGFPPRPAHFGPRLGGPSEASACVPRARFADHWFTFSDGGRNFHVDVAFGPRAPEAVRHQAWAILDRLRIDPTVRPDWRSSG
jgi:hypothetical protein